MFILNASAASLALGLLLSLVYELIAIFTNRLPTITSIVRPWVSQNRIAASTIAAVWIGATFWFLLHFFLPA